MIISRNTFISFVTVFVTVFVTAFSFLNLLICCYFLSFSNIQQQSNKKLYKIEIGVKGKEKGLPGPQLSGCWQKYKPRTGKCYLSGAEWGSQRGRGLDGGRVKAVAIRIGQCADIRMKANQ